MLRLSVPLRQALGRLTLPLLFGLAFAVMLVVRVDNPVVIRARLALTDALAPIYAVLAEPVAASHRVLDEVATLLRLRSDNLHLRQENAKLRAWVDRATALEVENEALRAALRFIPEAAPTFITVRVVADPGGVYARAVLIPAGLAERVVKGQVALDQRGLAGRVSEVGARSARVLLLTDINSRIPVMVEGTGTRAILAGTNSARPRLQHWMEGQAPVTGDRVVTAASAGAFPSGLPVGEVVTGPDGSVEVALFADLGSLTHLRLLDYGLAGILPPEAGGLARSEARAVVGAGR